MLSKKQIAANKKIAPLLEHSSGINLDSLIYDEHRQYIANAETGINIKPIYFIDEERSQFSLKAILWVTNTAANRFTKTKYLYKNLIEVVGPKLTEQETSSLELNHGEQLKKHLAILLNQSIIIAKNELTGKYLDPVSKPKPQTFLVPNFNKTKVVRGSLIEENCKYRLIEDLHHWLIAISKPLGSTISILCTSIITLPLSVTTP